MIMIVIGGDIMRKGNRWSKQQKFEFTFWIMLVIILWGLFVYKWIMVNDWMWR